MTASILEKIAAYKRDEVAAAKLARSAASLERDVASLPSPRDFAGALEAAHSNNRPALIAEIKKASPSRGLIRVEFDPPALAQAYEAGGAASLSVLTDGPSFQGSLKDLEAVRARVSLPLVRKDFMLDPYQMLEARACGADCILLIMAMIDDPLADDLAAAARAQGLAVLVEVHDAAELERALRLPTRLIGINNRDLHNFETRLETTEMLAPLVPADRIVIAESGIGSANDIARMDLAGVKTFLVGESLMRHADVTAATRILLGQPSVPS